MTKVNPVASVLIVDDTVENLRLLSGLLTTHGYEARPVTNGQQALLAAERSPPDIVLLDVNMPEMDGYLVCARLKENAALREIPVLFLTALSDTADKLRGFSVGGADYVTKPFQFDEVLARVKVHLELRAAQLQIRQQLERLQALEQLRDDLVHMVVHDMRSPLMALLVHLDLLKDDIASLGEEAKEDLKMASKSASGLTRMANDLLDVSRLEEGKMPLARAQVDVVEVAKVVCKSLSSLDRDRALEIFASEAMRASCDESIIKRVIENLVSNAIKHTPTGGRIHLRISRNESFVRLSVHDEGPGVPIEARARIFEKFETLSARKEHRFHSAGLGLAFCKLAVTAHGGRIGIDSGDPKGSIFWFEVPA